MAARCRRNEKKLNEKLRSSADPDSRIYQKPGKTLSLYYLAQISVCTSSHVICGAMASLADGRDSMSLPDLMNQTLSTLQAEGKEIKEVLADANYSSGSTLKYLEEKGITSYIPSTGRYVPQREGFTYDQRTNSYTCQRGCILSFKKVKYHSHSYIREYRSSRKDCRECPHAPECLSKKGKYKVIRDSLYRAYYERAHQRMRSGRGKRMMKIRGKTVEPVLGSLLMNNAMRKVYAKGLKAVNKHVLLAAIAYNLKKLIRYNPPLKRMAQVEEGERSGKSPKNKVTEVNMHFFLPTL